MPIAINKEIDHLFISLCKVKEHTFIMLGVYDQNKVRHLLCRVGKGGVVGRKNQCSAMMNVLCNILFFAAKAQLYDEGISRQYKYSQPISYQAYDISYAQYLEFLQILESLQTEENKFNCYKPIAEKGNEITLDLTDAPMLPAKSASKIKENICELSIDNTCRHSAIKLVETTQHAPIASLASEYFFVDLPYNTELEYGQPSKHIPFYVLPASPAAFPELDKSRKDILKKLYQRMEHMLLLKTHSHSTQDKFLKLKELYLQIIGPHQPISLDELLQSIRIWKEKNESTLAVLRKTYFWDSFFVRQSATMNLIVEVEHDLEMKIGR